MPTPQGSDPSGGHLEKPEPKGGTIGPRAQRPCEPRQRRLRSQSIGYDGVLRQRPAILAGCSGLERRQALPVRDGKTEHRVVAKLVGIILVAPALAQEEERRPQQLRERMRDELGLARILEMLDEPGDDVEPFHHVPQYDRAGFRAQRLGAPLHPQRTVELCTEWSKILDHDAPFWAGMCLATPPYHARTRRVSSSFRGEAQRPHKVGHRPPRHPMALQWASDPTKCEVDLICLHMTTRAVSPARFTRSDTRSLAE